jgi:hypothetical protein
MKYIEKPPRNPVGKITPRKRKEHTWVKVILAIGTLTLIIVISQFFK